MVARRTSSGQIRVIGDLRVTDENDIRHGYPFAVLKTVILDRDVLVGYAGNADYSTHTIRAVAPETADFEPLVAELAASSARAGNGRDAVDYLVAARGRDLCRVTAEGAEAFPSAAWIGDADAFNIYQRGYHDAPAAPLHIPGISPPNPPAVSTEDIETAVRMMSGVIRLQTDDSVSTVGEAFVSAYLSSTGFRYDQQALLAADHDQVVEGDEWVAADWGTVAEGGFGYSILVPLQPGVGLLGLYFPHPRLGLLYHPLKRDLPFVYRGVSHAAFRADVLEEHGVEVDGPSFETG